MLGSFIAQLAKDEEAVQKANLFTNVGLHFFVKV